ncbi:DEAD/DEAH box helicase family protein [Streptomyces leeuwenhoekii]|uniref:DEAD/DEAH box helicase family protein n=1 Tax=Streptomyces leeuwenhoekii TaxID=1437453 RepID=UPI001F18E8B4|nr:DEAD/DEAH box helicase family protein [Streptomyces leeuwenhoekii]
MRRIQYQEDYRSGHNNLIEDFYRPSLREANTYWRAVGYFSSTALESFGAPLGEFVLNNGKIRLVTSVQLTEADLKVISEGAPKEELCAERIQKIVETEFRDGMGDGAARLSRLLELDRLEIRIAIPKSGTGIYHEKIGLFFDSDGDYVAFSGSSNESRNAFEHNRECIDVYTKWGSPVRAERKRRHFEQVWDGTDIGVEVYSFPEAAKQQLLQTYRARAKNRSPRNEKWRHQEEALRSFLSAERGVLNMATGTGKTRTALKITKALFDAGEIDNVIVAMDGTDLLDQWYNEVLSIRNQLGRSPHVFRDYDTHKDLQEYCLASRQRILLVSRKGDVRRDPLASALRQLDSRSAQRTLLIHDEVHRLGSPGTRQRLSGLSDTIRFRLGLSATPDREYDEEGNSFIEEHIGPMLMSFDLSDAIERGILAPFNYHPLPYELTQHDRERIRDVYKKQAARAAAGEPMRDEEVWIELAKVHKTSPAKLPVFEEFISSRQDLLERCIIFVETQEYGRHVRDIVHRYRPDFHTYFTNQASSTLSRFARGDLQCLITCHRLSEGIDIQSLNSVILFSSSRARLETIQRIGRCIRSDPKNPKKVANVIDFIRSPDSDTRNSDQERAEWLAGLASLRHKEISV